MPPKDDGNTNKEDPISDCCSRSQLTWVCTVCLDLYVRKHENYGSCKMSKIMSYDFLVGIFMMDENPIILSQRLMSVQ